jgi:hypothetical protein
MQVAFDLADGPTLGPIQAMQVVDLISGEHGATSVIRWKPPRRQEVVVCKIAKPPVYGAEVLPKSRLGWKLSCCLQDPGSHVPAAKFLRRNALGRKLSCCLQDRAVAVFGLEGAAAGGSARRQLGAARDTAASNPDGGSATSASCPGRPDDIPDPRRSSGGDTRRDGGAGSPGCRRPTAPVGISTAGRPAHRSGIAVRPYGGCRILRREIVRQDLETECRVRTASWPMALSVGDNAATIAALSFRHQQFRGLQRVKGFPGAWINGRESHRL